jgi:aminoglycoside/choline kinase family phosphotransferase
MNIQAGSKSNAQGPRKAKAAIWAARFLGLPEVQLRAVSEDASFRRYFRFDHAGRSIILMDAPPDKEDSSPFIDIASRLSSKGLNAPEIFAFDLELGFGLIEDFGDTLYKEIVDEDSAGNLFPELFDILAGMARRVDPAGLPPFDEAFMLTEMSLFRDWYLGVHRNRPLRRGEVQLWNSVCENLVASATRQPQVFVHRDFHSCNLLQTPAGPGIIDFQDGVIGPLNYDFISLLWDRYIAWPRESLEGWMKDAHAMFQVDCSQEEWIRSCDWMGLQRNLKIVGIFARLNYRDGKKGYLEMIPRFYQYLLDVLPRYPEFREFHQLLEHSECAP